MKKQSWQLQGPDLVCLSMNISQKETFPNPIAASPAAGSAITKKTQFLFYYSTRMLILSLCLPLLSQTPKSAIAIKLTGIVALGTIKFAVLESPSTGPLIMKEGERNCTPIDVSVIHIDEKKGGVTLYVDDMERKCVMPSSRDENKSLAVRLRSSSFKAVLQIYQMLLNRTVIQCPECPIETVDLEIESDADLAQIEKKLVEAMEAKGVVVQNIGVKFCAIVPLNRTKLLASLPPPVKMETGKNDFLTPKALRFTEADFRNFLEVYSELAQRTVLRPSVTPQPLITVFNQTPLSRAEAIWLMEAVLSLAGLSITTIGDKFAVCAPPGLPPDLLAPPPVSKDEEQVLPEGTIRMRNAHCKLYCHSMRSMRNAIFFRTDHCHR